MVADFIGRKDLTQNEHKILTVRYVLNMTLFSKKRGKKQKKEKTEGR